jgi:hypothetical protein
MVFVHINPTSMSQSLTMSRSLVFTVLSILWSYIVGVKNTVVAMHSKEDCKVNPKHLYRVYTVYTNGGVGSRESV